MVVGDFVAQNLSNIFSCITTIFFLLANVLRAIGRGKGKDNLL